jgi:micrococcal nuclease
MWPEPSAEGGVSVLGVLAFACLLAGACGAFAYWYFRERNRRLQADAMTPEQRSWYEAESDYANRLAAAQASVSAVAQTGDRAVAAATTSLEQARLVGTRRLGSAGGVTLYENRIETPAGTFAFDGRKATGAAKASGSLRVLKSGAVKDTRKLTLKVRTPLFDCVVACPPSQQPSVEQLAFAVGNAASAWPQLKADAERLVAGWQQAVQGAAAKRDADNEAANEALRQTTSDRSAVDAARLANPTAYCPRCGANVLFTGDGGCADGHGASLCEAPRDGSRPAMPGKRDRRGELPALVIAALGVVLAMVSGAAALGQSPSTPAPPATQAAQETVPSSETTADASAALPATEPTAVIATRKAKVTKVVDGDTIDVRFDEGSQERVRLIGVDSPEPTGESVAVGQEASSYAQSALLDKEVYLEADAGARDNYGRLLAYVWLTVPVALTDAEIRTDLFNAKLALDGYAQQMTIPPNVKYADYFGTYVEEARSAQRGLWKPAIAVAPAPAPQPAGPSYIGNRNTRKFHEASCSSVDQMNEGNKVALESRDAAIAAGYVPCKRCKP